MKTVNTLFTALCVLVVLDRIARELDASAREAVSNLVLQVPACFSLRSRTSQKVHRGLGSVGRRR